MIDRRQFLVLGAACTATAIAAVVDAKEHGVSAGSAGLVMSVLPGRVFKRSDDQNRLQREYWTFFLVLHSSQPQIPDLQQLSLEYLSRGASVRITRYPGSVAALNLIPSVAASPTQDVYRVAAFQIADAAATALAVDRVRCEIQSLSGNGALERIALEIPIDTYVQRTELKFPFLGCGVITQGGAWNDGHRNRSGMFAIDAMGLTDRYAPMVGKGDAPKAMAGWGRLVLAPAAGEVVIARADRPDQPVTGVSDPQYFVAEFPQGGDPGNHCVIDHGNGEFSMLAHFQKGSLRVKVGDRVVQGQRLGLLGNSGDSSAPHLHHQLQTGAQWTDTDALPHVYVNGPERQHNRGVMFEAR